MLRRAFIRVFTVALLSGKRLRKKRAKDRRNSLLD
jgi:hypothetical protein